MANFEFKDNSDAVLSELDTKTAKALEMCGLLGEGYAKQNLTEQDAVDSGHLRNFTEHKVVDSDCYIGTNVEYGIYIEFGTGKYYPGGRQTPWVYTDRNGETHITDGQRARPFIKPAVAEHVDEYKRIIEDTMK